MKEVFLEGDFSRYKRHDLHRARATMTERLMEGYSGYMNFISREPTVFISHKHEDLEDLKGIIGFLEDTYKVKCYIDSKDKGMPNITSGETATKLKTRIKQCDKFILLASNNAIESKWCNWELGYGDADKFKDNIALFPFKRSNETYKGNEYMEIYPHIVKIDIGTYLLGKWTPSGYYVCETIEKESNNLIPLNDWLHR